MFLRQAVTACILLAAAAALPAQRDYSDVEIEAVKVAGKVWMLRGAGGNIGVSAGEDGILLVDDQFAPLAPKIRRALEGIGGGKVVFVLNTHWHRDHTGGNEAFGKEAPVIAHDRVRWRLSNRQELERGDYDPLPHHALPAITYWDGLIVHMNDERIVARHYPGGHTDGDSIVLFTGSNVVHMGDLFFAGRFPFVDLETGGDVVQLEKNIGKALRDIGPDTRIIPGHGELADRSDLEAYQAMLKESIAFVRYRMHRGGTLEEILAEGLPEPLKKWAWDFVPEKRWIRIVHDSLARGEMRDPFESEKAP